MKKEIRILRVFDIDIKLHYSWWFVFIFLSWALAANFFPHYFENYTAGQYWFMGITAALLLFVSVLLHELSHSLVAKWRKIEVKSITLFFFGGVAGITKEDLKPSSEFMMAVAGPLFSLVLAGIFFLIHRSNINGLFTAITFYLYQLNFILALFNLVPGYPLDGGRAFRAVLHAYYKDLRKATKIASLAGRFFAGVLIFLGIFSLISGAGGGLWFILLGGFLFLIARASYEQVIIKSILDKVAVKELMQKNYPILSPQMPFKVFLNTYINSEQDAFVVQGGRFTGLLSLRRINSIPREMHPLLKLKQLAVPFPGSAALRIKDSAQRAFRLFQEQNLEILPVKEGKNTVGFVSQKAVVNRLTWENKFTPTKKSRKHIK